LIPAKTPTEVNRLSISSLIGLGMVGVAKYPQPHWQNASNFSAEVVLRLRDDLLPLLKIFRAMKPTHSG